MLSKLSSLFVCPRCIEYTHKTQINLFKRFAVRHSGTCQVAQMRETRLSQF